jgi:UDP-N-acetylmuramoyl-L-alanyl-D-glutamate--2,6-diaminopimelate ligase
VALSALLGDAGVVEVRGDASSTMVAAVTHDSRAVTPGALFFCVTGTRVDGHRFAAEAVEAGAVALVAEQPLPVDVTQVIVADTRAAMGPIAAAFYGHPSARLDVVGVTGTNGKTTTTHLLRDVLTSAGRVTGLIGTLSGARTTPEAADLQATLAGMVAAGDAAVAMEVSSHALSLHRVDGTHFRVAVFTNLGRDHLDFHGDPETYFRAKAMLFDPERAAVGVVNGDDPHGRLLIDAARIPMRTYSLADAADITVTATASRFTWRGHRVELPLGGEFNIANALAAATAAAELGVDEAAIAAGLSSAQPVVGRLERVEAGQPFTVLVDYAHTPDALEQVLNAARQGTDGRVLVVFGCGGDRDRAKRPEMGEIATQLADLAVLTTDNPRSEDPLAIIEDVRSGVKEDDEAGLVVEVDRRAAIAYALRAAAPGDVVLIAGKGHETGQEVNDVVLPFDDRVVAREELVD